MLLEQLEQLAARGLEALAARVAPYQHVALQAPEQRVSDWQLVVPTQITGGGALEANAYQQGAPINLLAEDRPTLMQEWRLRGIAVPVGIVTKQASVGANSVVVVTATLRIGGDPVWSAAGETGRGSVVHNLTIGERFDEAIVLRHGQQLTLDLGAYCYEAVESLTVASSSRFTGAAGATRESVQGRLLYQAVTLDGRRRL